MLVGYRIWIVFVDYNLDESQIVKLYLSGTSDFITPFKFQNSINDGAFLSVGETVKIEYSTNRLPRGRGFKIAYKMGEDNNNTEKLKLFRYLIIKIKPYFSQDLQRGTGDRVTKRYVRIYVQIELSVAHTFSGIAVQTETRRFNRIQHPTSVHKRGAGSK